MFSYPALLILGRISVSTFILDSKSLSVISSLDDGIHDCGDILEFLIESFYLAVGLGYWNSDAPFFEVVYCRQDLSIPATTNG
ncbi:hypothetical protein AYI70_g8255 [Smittium culicis]|uniref:Uncharacterized protein n=1 Tax=Smittium culicis TaxID=133412 RepID=A0A1R1XGW6_9FUNG|nr:hypothetical protein AYI70_g8255 [Smittium culicis]